MPCRAARPRCRRDSSRRRARARSARMASTDDSPARFAADIQAKAHGRAAPALAAAYAAADRPGARCAAGATWPGVDPSRRLPLPRPQRASHARAAAEDRRRADGGAASGRGGRRHSGADAGGGRHAGARREGPRDRHRLPAAGRARESAWAAMRCCSPATASAATPRWCARCCPRWPMRPSAATSATTAARSSGALALGARLRDLGGYQGHGSWVTPQGALMSWAVMMEGGVQVNREGRRFHDETQGYSEAAVHVLAQPGGIAWNVFDAPLLALARELSRFLRGRGGRRVAPLRHRGGTRRRASAAKRPRCGIRSMRCATASREPTDACLPVGWSRRTSP